MNRSLQRLWLALAAMTVAAPTIGCSGPPVPSTITGEPICADYTIGLDGKKMRGGLRYPVRVTILDDDDPVTKALIYGKRSESDPSPKIVLPDKDAEYTVQWAVCVNERATVAVNAPKAKSLRTDMTSYDCGDPKPYKTDKLVTKKGDPASHALAFQAPEKVECWMDAKPADAPDAGAPDAAPPVMETPDAGAPDAEASDASIEDARATDAEASDASSGADAAAAKDEKPADKPAEKKDDKAGK